jgi:hypothetical protein
MVEYAAPQVRDTPEPFVSAIRAALGGRTEALEQLAVELAIQKQATAGAPSENWARLRPR